MWLIVITIIFCLLLFYYNFYQPLLYWKVRGIPHSTPHVIVGNLWRTVIGRESYFKLLQKLCTKFEKYRYFGFYQFSRPALVIIDRELIKQIFVKKFEYFTDHFDLVPKGNDIFWKKGLFARDGNDWHDMRTIISPTFTSRKMKTMFHLIVDLSERFVNYFLDKKGLVTLDAQDLFRKFNNDVIASCAFGVNCDSLENEQNEFYLMGKQAFDFDGIKSLIFIANAVSPTLSKLFKIKVYNDKIANFFMRITKETIGYRKKTGLNRPDVMHLLMEAQKGRLTYEEDDETETSGFAEIDDSYFKKRGIKKIQISDEDIASQAMIFFFGSYDTVSLSLSHVVYDLIANTDVQEKLIEEVDSTLDKCKGKITYEALLKMKYLDMVLSETMRLWPPPVILNRICVKPFTIEPILPNEKKIVVEPETDIILPVYAIHRNPKYFENPDKFDPERFSDENKINIQPLTYFPFGVGPRHCIGNRFALMIMKIILVSLLIRFEMVRVSKTVIPIEMRKNSIPIQSAHGYWFGLKPRKNKCL